MPRFQYNMNKIAFVLVKKLSNGLFHVVYCYRFERLMEEAHSGYHFSDLSLNFSGEPLFRIST